jgi:hypothetical protein
MANKYRRALHVTVANDPQIIYIVPPANAAIVASLRVTNSGSGTAYFSVSAAIEGEAPIGILNGRRLAANETMDVFSGVSFNMEAGDYLSVEADINDVQCWLSYLEVDRT